LNTSTCPLLYLFIEGLRNWRGKKPTLYFLKRYLERNGKSLNIARNVPYEYVPRFRHTEFPTKMDTKVPNYIPMLKQLTSHVKTLCRVRIWNLNINRNNIGVQLQSIVEHGLLGNADTPGVREPWWCCPLVLFSYTPIGRFDRGPLSPKRRLVVELGLQQVLQVHLRHVVHNVPGRGAAVKGKPPNLHIPGIPRKDSQANSRFRICYTCTIIQHMQDNPTHRTKDGASTITLNKMLIK